MSVIRCYLPVRLGTQPTMGRAGLVVHGQVHAVSSFVYVKNSVCFGSIFNSPKMESLRSGLPGEEGVESRVCELLPKAQGPPRTGNREPGTRVETVASSPASARSGGALHRNALRVCPGGSLLHRRGRKLLSTSTLWVGAA